MGEAKSNRDKGEQGAMERKNYRLGDRTQAFSVIHLADHRQLPTLTSQCSMLNSIFCVLHSASVSLWVLANCNDTWQALSNVVRIA
jgi:hypothetical protein